MIAIALVCLLGLLSPAVTIKSDSICAEIGRAIRREDVGELETLTRKLDLALDGCIVDLTPKYYWAQNLSHIFVKVTFTNSAETSACDRVLNSSREVSHSSFAIKVVCWQSGLILRYTLTVRIFMALNYFHHEWKQGEQNSLVLECLKSPNPYFWPRLQAKDFQPARQPGIWWKMVEKHHEKLKDYIGDLQINEDETDWSQRVRARTQTQGELYSLQGVDYSGESLMNMYCYQLEAEHLGSWL